MIIFIIVTVYFITSAEERYCQCKITLLVRDGGYSSTGIDFRSSIYWTKPYIYYSLQYIYYNLYNLLHLLQYYSLDGRKQNSTMKKNVIRVCVEFVNGWNCISRFKMVTIWKLKGAISYVSLWPDWMTSICMQFYRD